MNNIPEIFQTYDTFAKTHTHPETSWGPHKNAGSDPTTPPSPATPKNGPGDAPKNGEGDPTTPPRK